MELTSDLHLGDGEGTDNLVTINGGTVNVGNAIHVHSGTFEIKGGYISNTITHLGSDGHGHAGAIVSGGTWNTTQDFYVGNSSPGLLLMSGGMVTVSGTTFVTYSQTSGTMALEGGVFATNRILNGGGTATVTFDGGTLRALRNESDFIADFQPGSMTIREGGVFIDTNGFEVGISASFSGSGRLTKLGSGTLTLSGNQAHIGEIVVNEGMLKADGALAAFGITVNAGGILGGSGWVNEVVLNQYAIIAPGNSPGTLHTGSQVWQGGAIYQWEVDNLANPTQWDLLEIAGTLTLNPGEEKITLRIFQPNSDSGLLSDAPYRLTIATATGGIIGFSDSAFVIQNDFGGDWQFAIELSQDGRSLDLVYRNIPEPGTGVMVIGGSLLAMVRFRRRRQV